MRILVALLALFPVLAVAQLDLSGAQYLGTYQLTSGSFSGFDSGSVLSGNGITASIFPGPEMLSSPVEDTFSGGEPPLNFCFGCGLPGADDGVGVLSISNIDNPALAGLTQVFFGEGLVESGALSVAPTIDVTGAGTYTAAFTFSDNVYYGAPGSTVANDYVNVVGNGTASITFGPAQCPNGPTGPCGPLQLESLQYTIAPELDPASLSGALTLLGGGVLVLRGRRTDRVGTCK